MSTPALPLSPASFGPLLDHLPLALIVTDTDDNIAYINARYRQMLSIPAAVSLIGQSARVTLDYLLGSFVNAAAVGVAVEKAVQARQDLIDLQVELRDGRWMARDAVRLPDGGWLVSYRDVTAETLARQELEHVARIPAQDPNPIYRLAADGSVLFLNPAALALRAAISPKSAAVARAQMAQTVREALAGSEVREVEITVENRVFAAYVTPFPTEQYVNLYLVEITARRAAEEEVRRQRGFYESILTHLPADVVVIGPDLRYRYLNPQAVRDPERRAWLIGRDDLEYFAYRDRPLAMAERRQAILRQALTDGRQVSWEEEVARRDGTGVQYLTRSAQPVFDEDGAPVMLIGYGLDITPIREAQLTLARSEKQYRDLMEYTQALICTHDLHGKMLSVNPAILALLGYRTADIVGRTLVELMPPAYQSAVEAYLAQFAQKSAATNSGVLRVLPRHAAPRYLLYHNIRVEEAGQPPYIIGYAQDITERIQAERAAKRAREEAEAAIRTRENFLANMSHEIRTPLNGVLGMAGLLAKTSVDAYQHELLEVIQRSGRHLLGVLNDVLDMAKLSSEELELSEEAFDLCAAMSTALDPLVLQAQEKGITVHGRRLRDSCPYPWVVGDTQRLTQVVLNLLSNAVKFTPAGGSIWVTGDLLAETPETMTVVFVVRDTGIGIAPEQQENIFKPFAQAYASISREFGGTGLGLSISRSLVARMGGTLELTSTPGQGSTFTFTLTLPRARRPARTPDAAALPDTSVAGLRILLAEDNSVNRLLVRLLLAHHGAMVVEATTGAEAVAQAQAELFDVVLMDIQMPVMNGLQATAAIRALADPVLAAVPIVALTANAFRSDTEQYLAAGMDACLTKPFEEADLLRVLRTVVRWPANVAASLPAAVVPLADTSGRLNGFPATALRLGHGNPAFVAQIVAEFLATTPPLLAQVADATAAQADDVRAIAHQLAPAARLLDAAETAEALAELEDLPATDPQWADVRDYVVQELDDLIARLQQWQAEQQS